MRSLIMAAAASLLLVPAQPADSQPFSGPAELTHADLTDLALVAPVVAHVRVEDSDRLSADEAPNVAPGHRRFLVEASILALIRGAGGMPAQVAWLVDLPDDARGRSARIPRRGEYLLLATRVPGRPGELRLVAPDAMLAFSPERAERLRAIVADLLAADAAPPITGIGRAFHVPGSLPGEGETQIFLETAERRPISLSVLRRPGEQPRWSVALGEIIDLDAAAPRPGTLLWYRLACGLPDSLPADSLADAGPDEADAIVRDYRLIRERLGACTRNRSN